MIDFNLGDTQLYRMNVSKLLKKKETNKPIGKFTTSNDDELDELDFLTAEETKPNDSTESFVLNEDEKKHDENWSLIELELEELIYSIAPIHDMTIGTTPSIVSPIPYLNPPLNQSFNYYNAKDESFNIDALENSKLGLDLVICSGISFNERFKVFY